MKKLITENIMEGFVANHGPGSVFPIEESTLITPSAQDVAKSNKITFVDKESYCANKVESNDNSCCEANRESCCDEKLDLSCKEKATECSMSYDRQLIVEAILKILKEEGILDKILDK